LPGQEHVDMENYGKNSSIKLNNSIVKNYTNTKKEKRDKMINNVIKYNEHNIKIAINFPKYLFKDNTISISFEIYPSLFCKIIRPFQNEKLMVKD
jgi:hypothetical protein